MPANYHQTLGVLSSPSRPLTPGQQFQKIDEFQVLATPSNKGHDDSSDLKVSAVLTIPDLTAVLSLQRYQYYVREGVSEDDLAPFPSHTLPAVHSRLSPSLLTNPDWSALIDSLHQEIIAVSGVQFSL